MPEFTEIEWPEADDIVCANCAYWWPLDTTPGLICTVGKCRLLPPVVDQSSLERRGVWPTTDIKDFCARFAREWGQ